ncbi:MAG: hypothetical protein WHS44_11650 [Fimbriimonadales bacterium]|nr:MAG: hypothetical protein KatS3mg018_0033 [Fimbriimonadales bacterium]
MPITINDVEDLARLLEQHPDWQARLARVLLNKQTLARLLQDDPALTETLREALIGDQLARLIATVQELAALVRASSERSERQEVDLQELRRITSELVETSRQAVARLDRHEAELQELRRITSELVETSRQSIERIEALERTVAELAEVSRQSAERIEASERLIAQSLLRLEALEDLTREVVNQLGELQKWQRGEAGNREGERYQRIVRKQAWQLFYGGQGGETDEPHVEQKLRQWLRHNGVIIQPEKEANPVDADLIWWKGDRVAVVEISVKVNGRDVNRAVKRAQTLREVGVDAMPVVVGQEWAHPDTRAIAAQTQVAWKVGDDISETFIAFRQLPEGD